MVGLDIFLKLLLNIMQNTYIHLYEYHKFDLYTYIVKRKVN